MERNVVKSAARVLHILEFFDEVKCATSVAEVAEHHGWPHSSTSVLMRSLVALGYLHYDPSERSYFPSTRVALLGDWIQDNRFKDGQLMRLMHHLNDETGETVVLAAQNGLHSQYLRVIQGTNTLRMHLHIGTLRPLFVSGTGRALLSHMDPTTIRKLARKHNAGSDPQLPLDIPRLLKQAAADRTNGYAMSLNHVTPRAGSIAMPLATRPQDRLLVIGLAGLSDRLVANEQRYAEAMRRGVNSLLGD
jgi:DNA-binding IclR family transcriptional regulator